MPGLTSKFDLASRKLAATCLVQWIAYTTAYLEAGFAWSLTGECAPVLVQRITVTMSCYADLLALDPKRGAESAKHAGQ